MTDPSTARVRPIDAERQFAGERRSAGGENRHHRHLWPVVAALLPDRPSNVLDVACGNGFLASRMAQSGHHVTAFDLSAENVAESGRIIVTAPYHGYVKNVALSVLGQFDKHFEVYFEGGHIKFFSRRSLDAMFAAAGFRRPSFRYAGRVPLLWKSMVCWVDDSGETPPPR